MPLTKLPPVPFVKWEFLCKNDSEKKKKQKDAKKYIQAVCKGYNKARKDMGLPEVRFVIKGKFVAKRSGSRKFVFEPELFLDPSTDPTPAAAKEPPPPPKPGL
jgi:hypothetical protein